MILGRPTNLWLGLVTAASGALLVTLVSLGYDPVQTATILGGWVGVVGAGIALVANQPPTLAAGDQYTIQTPKGEPNYTATVAPPPAPTQPAPEAAT